MPKLGHFEVLSRDCDAVSPRGGRRIGGADSAQGILPLLSYLNIGVASPHRALLAVLDGV